MWRASRRRGIGAAGADSDNSKGVERGANRTSMQECAAVDRASDARRHGGAVRCGAVRHEIGIKSMFHAFFFFTRQECIPHLSSSILTPSNNRRSLI
jgi:hypothetical protein